MTSGLYFLPLAFLGSSIAEVQGEAITDKTCNTRNVTTAATSQTVHDL